jgi:hypothetical protein
LIRVDRALARAKQRELKLGSGQLRISGEDAVEENGRYEVVTKEGL